MGELKRVVNESLASCERQNSTTGRLSSGPREVKHQRLPV